MLTCRNCGEPQHNPPMPTDSHAVCFQCHSPDLSKIAATVRIQCIVEQRFTPIIRTNTKFWNVSGIRIDTNLLGIDLRAGPLTSWIKGGVACATPTRLGDLAPEDFAFTLEHDLDKDLLDWSPEIDLSQHLESE